MKKTLIALTLILVLILSLAGCGAATSDENSINNSDNSSEEVINPADDVTDEGEEIKAEESTDEAGKEDSSAPAVKDAILGEWECIDATVTSDGLAKTKEFLCDIYELDVKSLANLKAYENGSGKINLFGTLMDMSWVNSGNEYKMSIPMMGNEGEGVFVTAVLDGNKLTIRISDDGNEPEYSASETVVVLAYKGPLA